MWSALRVEAWAATCVALEIDFTKGALAKGAKNKIAVTQDK